MFIADAHPSPSFEIEGTDQESPFDLVPEPYRVADRCRSLLLELMCGSRTLDRRALVSWLTRYHELAIWVDGSPRPADALRRRSPIDRAHIQQWLHEAIANVTTALEVARDPWKGPSFVLDATLDESIVPFCDASGRRGWRPATHAHRTLGDKALALLAVDCAMRPSDYQGPIRQCVVCARVWFEGEPTPLESIDACCRIPLPHVANAATWRRRARDLVSISA